MKIQVLMSTYNGALYLPTQLESIISQTVQEKILLIRDDGSTDATTEILEKYSQKYHWISYYSGCNIGVQKSFFDLMARSDMDADYVAFADQDDEWMPRKLEHAINCLEQLEYETGKGIPLLYCGAQNIVDENLNSIKSSISRTVKKPSFGNALVQNICTGCTAVGNHSLIELLKNHLPVIPEAVIMHDWWMYLTASCFGKVYYDQVAYIKYRQHGRNTFGAQTSHWGLFCYRLNELKKPRGQIYRQLEAFIRTYDSQLDTVPYYKRIFEIKKLLKSEYKIIDRILIFIDRTYYRQKLTDDLVFRVIVLLGKL